MSQIILGTANLNKKYGFLKKSIRFSEFKKIIKNSNKNKVRYIDTSINYSGVHKILGKLNLNKIKVITKISIPTNNNINAKLWIKKIIKNIVRDLKTRSLYCVLIHNSNILLNNKYKKYILNLNELKKKGKIKKIGFSVYNLREAKILLKKYKFDILQVPLNIINQTFCDKNFLQNIRKKNIEIHARSIFLQGILLSKDLRKMKYFKRWRTFWKDYYNWLNKNRVSGLTACLSFINGVKNISGYVIGIENEKQFKQVLDCKIKKNLKFESFLSQKNKKLIDPSKWK